MFPVSRRTPLPPPVIRALCEADIDSVIENAGGGRAHPDADRRTEINADYRLGDTVIELKFLDDEGLEKPEHQAKLATLFSSYQPGRPVVVLDPQLLPPEARRDYATIVERPVRGAVAKGRAQLKQSRNENPDIATTVLFVINNGFAALTQEELVEHVVRRAKNDSREIDGIVVGGCYFHSDGFDTVALWPLDYVAIHPERPFAAFDALKDAWDGLSERHMTDFVTGKHGLDAKKKPVADITFDLDGITYVKPAIAFGSESKFYGRRRPRLNALDFEDLPHVATTIPTLTEREYRRFRAVMEAEQLLMGFESWLAHVKEAMATSEPLRPVVPIEVTRGGWESWRKRHREFTGLQSLRVFANERFNRRASDLLNSAREMTDEVAPPRRYIGVSTELIGQDVRNDISHIAFVFQRRNTRPQIRPLVSHARISHEHALSLGAAYAVLEGVDAMFWRNDLQFAWT